MDGDWLTIRKVAKYWNILRIDEILLIPAEAVDDDRSDLSLEESGTFISTRGQSDCLSVQFVRRATLDDCRVRKWDPSPGQNVPLLCPYLFPRITYLYLLWTIYKSDSIQSEPLIAYLTFGWRWCPAKRTNRIESPISVWAYAWRQMQASEGLGSDRNKDTVSSVAYGNLLSLALFNCTLFYTIGKDFVSSIVENPIKTNKDLIWRSQILLLSFCKDAHHPNPFKAAPWDSCSSPILNMSRIYLR